VVRKEGGEKTAVSAEQAEKDKEARKDVIYLGLAVLGFLMLLSALMVIPSFSSFFYPSILSIAPRRPPQFQICIMS
jgi:hypothetical protein